MARSSNRNRRDISTTTSIATRSRVPVTSSYSDPLVRLSSRPLIPYEDRRLWHPEGDYAPARSFSKPRHRLVVPKVSDSRASSRSLAIKPLFPSAKIGFAAPKKVLICVRRRIRKQVIHALKKAGRRGQRRPRRNFYSSISCR